MQRETIEEHVQKLHLGMDERSEQEQEAGDRENEAADSTQDIYVLIVREREEGGEFTQIVDSIPVFSHKTSFLPAYAICGLYLFCILTCLAFQVYCIFNPPIATVTIVPKSQTVTMTGVLQLGRVLQSLTISQSQTVPATGKGHQDARYATGQLTFYNGQLQSVTISNGTLFTGRDGIQIAITQDAVIPAADPTTNPPTFGQVAVSAQAIRAGARGNVQAFDISGSCCAASVIVKNLAPFANGQDARNFTYVKSTDIQQATSALTPMLLLSEQGALSAQLHEGETLTTPTCTPRVFSNHHPEDEAASVQVTLSETCKAVAYDQQSLQEETSQAMRTTLVHLRTPYQLIGPIQVTVRSDSTQNGKPILTATWHGVWVSQINGQHIKTLVAGKHKLTAIQLLLQLPGVKLVSIAGIADNTLLPYDLSHIHVHIFVAAA